MIGVSRLLTWQWKGSVLSASQLQAAQSLEYFSTCIFSACSTMSGLIVFICVTFTGLACLLLYNIVMSHDHPVLTFSLGVVPTITSFV